MSVFSSKQYDKMSSAKVAAVRLGVSLVNGRLPARIEAPRVKFIGGARKRHVAKGGLATSWPSNNA